MSIISKGHDGEIGDAGISGMPGDRVSSTISFTFYFFYFNFVFVFLEIKVQNYSWISSIYFLQLFNTGLTIYFIVFKCFGKNDRNHVSLFKYSGGPFLTDFHPLVNNILIFAAIKVFWL